jgi:hypothetical protein
MNFIYKNTKQKGNGRGDAGPSKNQNRRMPWGHPPQE